MSERSRGLVLCGLAMATVGSSVVASKTIAAGLPPFTATALRFALAFPLLWWWMRRSGASLPRPGRHDAWLLLCQAGLGSVGYTVLMLLGLRWTSAGDAGVVAGTLPAVTALVATLLLRERAGGWLWGSIGLATLGVLAVNLPPTEGLAAPRDPLAVAGNLLVLGAVGCEAVFILLNKRLRVPLPPLVMATLMSGLGFALSLLPALGERAWAHPVSWPSVAAVAYYALVPTVAGFLLWFAGSARVSGGYAALSTAWLPVSALLLAALWLGEAVTGLQVAGVACVLVAVGLAARGDDRRRSSAGARQAGSGPGAATRL